MTSEAKEELLKASAFLGTEGGGCGGVLKAADSFGDESQREQLKDFKVTSVKINGDKAVADDNIEGEEPTQLRKKGDTWLIDKDPEKSK
jgi:hypothetical protein